MRYYKKEKITLNRETKMQKGQFSLFPCPPISWQFWTSRFSFQLLDSSLSGRSWKRENCRAVVRSIPEGIDWNRRMKILYSQSNNLWFYRIKLFFSFLQRICCSQQACMKQLKTKDSLRFKVRGFDGSITNICRIATYGMIRVLTSFVLLRSDIREQSSFGELKNNIKKILYNAEWNFDRHDGLDEPPRSVVGGIFHVGIRSGPGAHQRDVDNLGQQVQERCESMNMILSSHICNFCCDC